MALNFMSLGIFAAGLGVLVLSLYPYWAGAKRTRMITNIWQRKLDMTRAKMVAEETGNDLALELFREVEDIDAEIERLKREEIGRLGEISEEGLKAAWRAPSPSPSDGDDQ